MTARHLGPVPAELMATAKAAGYDYGEAFQGALLFLERGLHNETQRIVALNMCQMAYQSLIEQRAVNPSTVAPRLADFRAGGRDAEFDHMAKLARDLFEVVSEAPLNHPLEGKPKKRGFLGRLFG